MAGSITQLPVAGSQYISDTTLPLGAGSGSSIWPMSA
jgi:hypothetical protein